MAWGTPRALVQEPCDTILSWVSDGGVALLVLTGGAPVVIVPPPPPVITEIPGAIMTGFEEYFQTSELTVLCWDTGGGLGSRVTVVTSSPRSGAKCLLIDHANHALAYLQRNVVEVDDQTVYTRELIRFDSFATVATVRHWLMSYSNSTPLFKRGVAIDATVPKLRFDATDLAGTGTASATTLVTGTWYLLEFMYYRKSGVEFARQYRLSQENGTLIEESDLFTSAETGPFDRFQLGSTVTQGGDAPYTTYRVDDFILMAIPGKALAQWIGTGRVGVWGADATILAGLVPTGSSPNHVNVDEVPGALVNDADYNTGLTSGQLDRYGGAPVGGVPITKAVRRFTVQGRTHVVGSFNGVGIRTQIVDAAGGVHESATASPLTSVPEPITLVGCASLSVQNVTVGQLADYRIGVRLTGNSGGYRVLALCGTFDYVD